MGLKDLITSGIIKIKAHSAHLASFLNGGVTTFIGSACCGPMLGYAMGLALGMNITVIVLVFLSAGIGMSVPYILFPMVPGAMKMLPKPGKWMLWLERLAGIAMIMSSLWFFYLAW